MTGGAFKNSSNLLARNREIEELEQRVQMIQEELKQIKSRREDIATAIELNADELESCKEALQKKFIAQNTAKLNLDRATQQKDESEQAFSGLLNEREQMEQQIAEIAQNKQQILDEMEFAKTRETEINEETARMQEMLETQNKRETEISDELSKMQLEEANLRQSAEFNQMNIDRINGELEKFDAEQAELMENAKNSKEDAKKKQNDIEEIKKTLAASDDSGSKLQKQEEISKRCNDLDKEIFRLNNQREKLTEESETQTNYLWTEYELTPHAAMELRNEMYDDLASLKKLVAEVKDEIRKLGDVNVNAIEEYKEVSERYTFLKGQHDDLVEAEETLLGIIEDLDTGMRKQFTEKFAEIQREFDASFKHLFGGGHGTLELVEDEDILECGIRIIAQPPGKKLQNMMQLSGGEKALTAIALLFAIQALKPSPFCLLDEIEAALDDSNVTRFASYLNKLTKNTQFIVITHRRGTMTAADRLYGITMQEKGVSTLVSVNLIENDLTA